MGLRRFSTHVTANTTITTTTETVVATLSGVSTNQPGQKVSLRGELTLTTGTATSDVTLRVREDSLTGTLVGEASPDTIEAAAGGNETHTVYVEHTTPGEVNAKTYVLTVQQTAATGDGTGLQASLVGLVTP